jgi:Tol biopolymer transport system component
LFLRFFLLLAAATFVTLAASGARAADDPKLLWKSIETTHFRITYYSTEDEVAEHVATLAEAIYARLAPAVETSTCVAGSVFSVPTCGSPRDRAPDGGPFTDILLTDQTDSANGSATALPYNAIRLNVTAPDDMSPLGDVDDWYLELVTHEYTHILHTDHIRGIPALINWVIGKTYAPNQMQPRWLLEGLAVFEESTRTSGGRLRSSMWNMFMRADVLEENAAPIDVFSNTPRRWPQGNIWYLYGSFFMKWIAETYGEQAIRAMIDDYGWQLIPFGINRSIRRATGHTYEELYVAWMDSLRRTFGAQAAAIRDRGVREGFRLTHTGNTVEHPRWIPASSWPEHAGDLAYYVDDGHTVPGYWALPLIRDLDGRIAAARESARELLIRGAGVGGLSFMPDGAAVFSTQDIHKNLFLFDDLFELPAHEKSQTGLEGDRIRWTDGWRAIDPSVSPDGRQVAFTVNHRGTTYLMMADLVGSEKRFDAHRLANPRALGQSARFDQAFTPRWSPDGKHVAYSSWQRGGYRDVRIVDTTDGTLQQVTHDRAIDGDPVYSADGRWLFFHSDRSGVMNIYAYELSTSRLRQVTNVVNGAYQPEPSPDGKSLAYVGYTHDGYDVFVMSLDESQWLEPEPYVDTRGEPPPEPPPVRVVPRPYNPWSTLVPRAFSFRTTPGNFGQATVVTVSGGDIAGLHGITANLMTEWSHPELEGSLSYAYARLPFDVGMSIARQITPQTNYQLGSNTIPYAEDTTYVSTSIGYSILGAFDTHSFNLSYTIGRSSSTLPLPLDKLNPYDTPSRPPTASTIGTLHLGWGYSNAVSTLWSVSNESGFDVGASLDVADRSLASDSSGYAATVNFATYLSMPFLRHHVLALHGGGGTSGGNAAGRGPYYIGGFVDLPVVNVVQNDLIQGGIELRGYPVVGEEGENYALFNGEYRFPIVNVDRGASTLPFFLQSISGAAFLDYGSAFQDASTARFKTGVGGELWFNMTLGYTLGFTFRTGYAKGLASGGIDKTYFVAAVPF